MFLQDLPDSTMMLSHVFMYYKVICYHYKPHVGRQTQEIVLKEAKAFLLSPVC